MLRVQFAAPEEGGLTATLKSPNGLADSLQESLYISRHIKHISFTSLAKSDITTGSVCHMTPWEAMSAALNPFAPKSQLGPKPNPTLMRFSTPSACHYLLSRASRAMIPAMLIPDLNLVHTLAWSGYKSS